MIEGGRSGHPEASRRGRWRATVSVPSAFRTLVAGSSISMLGSRISTIAFPMLVLLISNSPFIAGLVTFATIVPSVLAYMPAGAFVDRWDPWRVMLFAEVLRGFAIASVVILVWGFGDRVSIYLLVCFMITEEILEIFWILADRRLMNHLVDRSKMAAGQASVEARSHMAVLLGRPLGPWLFAVNKIFPFLADAVSFAFSVAMLIMLRGRRLPIASTQNRRLLDDIGEGLRWLRQNRYTGIVMLVMSFTTLIAQALIMVFLAGAHDKQLPTATIGVVLAASGVGGVIGSAVTGRLPGWVNRYWLQVQLCAWSAALGLLAVTGVRVTACIAVATLILGFAGSMGNIMFATYLMRAVGGNMLGRVTSVGQVMTIAASGLGPLLGGGAIQRLGFQAALGVIFGLVLIVTASSFCVPQASDLSVDVSGLAVDISELAVDVSELSVDPVPVASVQPDGFP